MDALAFYRVGSWCRRHHVPVMPGLMKALGILVFSAVVPAEATIGRDTMLGYGGIGVIIHPRSVVGENVLISPGVTLGGRSKSEGVPLVGDNVFIGSGAKVLGAVTIGDGAVIGANAVVTHDVPARALAVGIPARITKTDVAVEDHCRLPRTIKADRHG